MTAPDEQFHAILTPVQVGGAAHHRLTIIFCGSGRDALIYQHQGASVGDLLVQAGFAAKKYADDPSSAIALTAGEVPALLEGKRYKPGG